MKRYATLDILRGASILGMVFLHLVDDLYDKSWIPAEMASHSMFDIVLLITALFFGSWAGLFLLVSATGNMVSMHGNLEKGATVKSIVTKQVVGGLILLLFGFLAEGTLQYYGLFQTIRTPPFDITRVVWKGYTMETIHTIAYCMILNGIVQGILSMNRGHLKAKRNMIVYAILAIAIIVLTQPVWNFCKDVALSNGWSTLAEPYPFGEISGRIVQSPSVNADFLEYIGKFLLLPLGGQPEPVFPFLAVSFVGSIIGIAITRKDVSHDWPRQGNLVGVLVMVAGVAIFVVVGLTGAWDIEGDLTNVLIPLDKFSMFSAIYGGQNYGWLPWICLITGGQISMTCICFRLIEHRGNSNVIAEKSKFIRKFGMIPFTFYTFHRIFAMAPLLLMSLIFQVDMTIDVHNLDGWVSLGLIAVCLLFMYGIALLWERVDYIGSLEWMIGTIGAYALGTPRKSEKRMPWYRWGARDQQALFYNVDWVTLFEKGDNGGIEYRESKLAMKMAIGGLFIPIGTMMGCSLYRTAEKAEGKNKYSQVARVVTIIAAIINVTVITALVLLPFGVLGISF
ncbi:MAG: DUF1624 domain-containing protein [Candidatus Lokiarchaeota archaeon]|nr:DUF1624 domain-containing protein [Candidatus Lokiarchaeota archaeon]